MTFDELRAKYPRLLRPNSHFMCHEGWIPTLDAYFAVVDHVMPVDAVYQIGQIKEKLGTLRIYVPATVRPGHPSEQSPKPIGSPKRGLSTRANIADSAVGCASVGRTLP
ncbi:hypothetical protein [Sinorhizobium meliloti]|uniref:hypothetical protein n=1 Tax=Rhizobium meliloti TaxID=382 RepID=UPI000FE0CBEC|nr:hypothetical protein [Sinorhizobium meliloti]RVL94713.1 hypothetical protein CN136_21600 [Sinorhizobium meliloti]